MRKRRTGLRPAQFLPARYSGLPLRCATRLSERESTDRQRSPMPSQSGYRVYEGTRDSLPGPDRTDSSWSALSESRPMFNLLPAGSSSRQTPCHDHIHCTYNCQYINQRADERAQRTGRAALRSVPEKLLVERQVRSQRRILARIAHANHELTRIDRPLVRVFVPITECARI